ncbi:MAG: ArnT family glycosyltransferase [Flavisolibacter sp.]
MRKPEILSSDLNTTLGYFFAILCVITYAGSFFFPLMDKDAAHHANIALHMVEHKDYINLIDRGQDYLDKPHFLFWISALSFQIFGVNTFADRFPAFLFTLLSLFSTYKLCRHLSDKTTARLSALILATAQAFIFSLNDARMEAPLTAWIITAIWQLALYIDKRHFISLALSALATALAFSTKGWIGPAIIFVSALFYVMQQRSWSVLFSVKTWLFIPVFVLFISPVLYAYYQQFDLHPDKIIRGQSHRSGIRFILWDQLFERSEGFDQGNRGRNSDYFFLYHTFLWAFFPWSIMAYTALIFWIRKFFVDRINRQPFQFAALSFLFVLFLISFSKFKMPHYIVMLFPLAAIFTGDYVRHIVAAQKALNIFYPMHLVFALIILVATIALNYYFFWPPNFFVLIFGSLLMIVFVILLIRRWPERARQLIYITAGMSLLFNFFLNYDFFPNLMKYQAGNELAMDMKTRALNINDNDILLIEQQAHSFDFYRGHNHQLLDAESFSTHFPGVKDKYFLLTNSQRSIIEQQGFKIEPVISHVDYNVAIVKYNFLNPATRNQVLDTLMLAKIYPR